MLCEPISSDNEEKEGDELSVDCLINLNILTTNIDFFSVAEMCTGEGYTYDIIRGKKPGNIHLLCWDLLLANSDVWTEGYKETSPWLQYTKI